jgi:nitrate reductase NapAB chaperone NapD
MMTTQKNLMESTWTPAAKVRRAFKAGPKRRKDKELNTVEAVFEAGMLLHKLRMAMEMADERSDDVQAALVLVTPPDRENAVHVLPVPQHKRFSTLFADVERLEKLGKVIPLGMVFRQRDRKAEDMSVWTEPFLTGHRAESALRQSEKIFAEGKAGKSAF